MLLASCYGMRAQRQEYAFTHLNTAGSELSFNKVHFLAQDANGFIWMGTADGLDRYDGRNFQVYSAEDLGIGSSFVVSLCADDKGNVWVGTDTGISKYNFEMDRFEPLDILSDKGTAVKNKVSKIAIDKHGTVWFTVLHQGLFSYDGDHLVNWFWEDGHLTLPNGIRSFFIDNNGVFWIALYFDDLYYSDDSLKTLRPVGIGKDGAWFRGDDIISISKNYSAGTLLTASNNHGLCEVDPRAHTARELIPNKEGAIIESMTYDAANDRVWLATTRGLWYYHLPDGYTEQIMVDPNNPYGLSDNHIFYVLSDRSENLWIATYSHGVDYSGFSASLFGKYRQSSDGGSLKGSLFRSMSQDHTGRLWITSEEQGLFYFDSKNGSLSRYHGSRLPDNLSGLCCDDGDLWIGSFDGMYRLHPDTGRLKLYSRSDDAAEFKDSKIYRIRKTSTGEIYFGTTLGLFRYNRGTDSFLSIPEFRGVFVTDIFEDHTGTLWLSTYADGIFSFHPDDSSQEILHWSRSREGNFYIPSDKLMSLEEDREGRIWVASFGAGFMMKEQNEPAFRTFDKKNVPGLPSDVFYMIEEDSAGNVWLSSNKGLVAYSPDKGLLGAFSTADGLIDNEFNYHSSFRCADGRLIFGSANGMVYFRPQQVLESSTSSSVILTEFRVNDERVQPSAKDACLSTHIEKTQRIVLKPSVHSFGFKAATPGSGMVSGQAISFRLEGHDLEWRNADPDGGIRYENIPPGRYKLYVRSREDQSHAPLEIIVRQKVYKTALAYILYALLLLLLIIGLTLQVRRNAKRRADKELYQEKLSFFANVIHEIKTPLTLIKTPLQNITSTGAVAPSAADDLAVINNSTEYLNRLVRELLEFIQVEKHGYVLEYKEVDLVERIEFLCFNFSEAAKTKNLELQFHHDESSLPLGVDESALNKILTNLIDNAVKYAETYVRISAERSGDKMVILFSNDGPMIPEGQRKEIFKPFVQFSRNDSFSQSFGIGLSLARNLAQLHGGTLTLDDNVRETCFRLTLPIVNVTTPTEGVSTEDEIIGDDSSLPLLLVVEDNTDLLGYLKNKLSGEYRILMAKTAEKALQLLSKSDVNVILTDISLPGKSGIELCREVKADLATAHIPVVILSAISSSDTKVLCLESGASQYIEKPFNLEYLKVCLKSEIEKRMTLRRSVLGTSDAPLVVPGTDMDFIDRLNHIIQDNISQPEISNDMLANALYVSKTTLIRKVKGLLGTSPGEYVRTYKLNLAAQMLQSEGFRISDVCYAVGFNTPSYFAKCFKKQFGVLPVEYMKMKHK